MHPRIPSSSTRIPPAHTHVYELVFPLFTVQVHAKVVFVHDRYYYRGKRHDLAPKINAISSALRAATRTVVLAYPSDDTHGEMPATTDAVWLHDYVAAHKSAAPRFVHVGFDSPVYIMFSSGTTGVPKCMLYQIKAKLECLSRGYLMDQKFLSQQVAKFQFLRFQ